MVRTAQHFGLFAVSIVFATTAIQGQYKRTADGYVINEICGKTLVGRPENSAEINRLRVLEIRYGRNCAEIADKTTTDYWDPSEEMSKSYSKHTGQALERVSNGLAQKQADAATRRIREQRLQRQREAEARRAKTLARQKELIEKSRRRLAACKRVGRGSCAKPI